MRHVRMTFAALVAVTILGCDRATAPVVPGTVEPWAGTQQTAAAGTLVAEPPAVRVLSADGRPLGGVRVSFEVRSGGGVLTGTSSHTGASGIARAGGWTLGAQPGFNEVRAVVEGLTGSEIVFGAIGLPAACTTLVDLDLDIGGFHRFTTGTAQGIPCLVHDPADGSTGQYLLLLENMPLFGASSKSLFPATTSNPSSDTTFAFTLRGIPDRPVSTPALAVRRMRAAAPPEEPHTWDFGAGRIHEHRPAEPAVPPGPARVRGRDGRLVDITSAAAEPQVGDTIHGLRMEGIARLGIGLTFDAQAVIRHVSPDLIIAEDTRLATTLTRENGRHNTPLDETLLNAIAAEYADVARGQGDMLFDGIHNASAEAAGRRVVAVHSLMFADNIWGYTYSVSNYFVFDYWVLTDGSTAGLNQHPERVADNLFMHEIAHMRHWGVLERNGYPPRGHLWLVEGFARFSERLPIAARLLGSTTPSRTANVVLPLNPAFNLAYFRDDVPSFLNAGTGFFGGYQHSSWMFDYFADQVALGGGDWRAAVRDLLVAGGRLDALNATLGRWIPGMTLAELITRARIALYTDDIDGAQLPAWTQYHQYQLRLSRPRRAHADPPELPDPRDAWTVLTAGSAVEVTGTIAPGAAAGYIIDGSQSSGRTLYTLDTPSSGNVAVSLTRIR